MGTAVANTFSRFIEQAEVPSLRPGVMAALALSIVAVFMSRGLGGIFAQSPLFVAILIGLLIGNSFGCPDVLEPGLTFVVKKVLRLSVMLVGFRITFDQVATIGLVPFLIAAIVLTTTFLFARWVAIRFFKVEEAMAYLIAAGCAICGASAILAVAAVVKAQARHTTVAVTLIALFGTLTLLTYPLAFVTGYLPGFDEHTYGVFVGATLYEVAQVVGAGYSVSELAGNTAVVIKLSKVLMLIPLLLILSMHVRRQHPEQTTKPPAFPWFVIGFVVLLLINSLQIIPTAVVNVLKEGNLFLLTMVMVASGLRTPVGKVQQLRWAMRPTLAMGLIFIVGSVFGYGLVLASSPLLMSPGDLHQGRPYAYTDSRTSPETSTVVEEGERIFEDIGCHKCHVPSLSTKDGEQIFLYSDLLLHDMGPALDDKIIQGEAKGSEWRTAPLWGLGLRTHFLHDGRATTIHDAIAAHGGEADIVVQRYRALSEADQEALINFLRTR